MVYEILLNSQEKKYIKILKISEKSLKILSGRALGALILAKILPRGSWIAPRRCPEVSRRA